MKYIDAERLQKEIERQIMGIIKKQDANPDIPKHRWYLYEGMKEAFNDIGGFIDSLQQDQSSLPGIEENGIPGKDFIPVEWVDACEKYSKWKIVKVEQPDVDLEKEIEEHVIYMPHGEFASDNERQEDVEWAKEEFEHFYKLGLNARKEE